MSNTPSLPNTIDQVSADWLNDVLGIRYAGSVVEEVRHTNVLHGSGTKIEIALRYASNPHQLPTSLYVKAALEDHGLPVSIAPEAIFYDIVKPQIQVSVPLCVYADHAQEPGVVVLENLLERGCRMSDPTVAWSVDETRDALQQLASLHARWWGRGRVPDVPDFTGSNALGAVLIAGDYWDSCLAGPTAVHVPAMCRDRDRMGGWVKQLWALDASEPKCFLHGDAHLGNTYFDAEGRPGFLDWQGIRAGHWGREFCYFTAGALGIEDRRQHEEALLGFYLDQLAAGGASPLPTWDEAWLTYRQHMTHGLLWFLCPTAMQPIEIINANVERFGAAALDHRVDRLF